MSNFKVLGCVEVALKSYPVGGGWWVGVWVANTYIVMPLRGPTCKIARFQAELKFPSWTECGNKLGVYWASSSWGFKSLPRQKHS